MIDRKVNKLGLNESKQPLKEEKPIVISNNYDAVVRQLNAL